MTNEKIDFSDSLQSLFEWGYHKRKRLFQELNSLAYYGNGGFPYDMVKKMTVAERRLNIKIINERNKEIESKRLENSKTNELTENSTVKQIQNINKRMQETTKKEPDYKIPMKK